MTAKRRIDRCGVARALLAVGVSLLACARLAAAANAKLPADVPATPPDSPLPARTALRFDPLSHCPDLRQGQLDDEQVAVVVFLVGPTGVPSRATIRMTPTSSGSEQLNAAAIACVMKLRFRPATSLGEGNPIASWQQISWKWAPHAAQSGAAGATAPAAMAPAATAAAVGTAGAYSPAPAAAAASPTAGTAAQPGAVAVRVCVDETGNLTQSPTIVHSSGDARFDAAAVEIARAGSGHYRPASGADGKPVAGCEQLSLRNDGR